MSRMRVITLDTNSIDEDHNETLGAQLDGCGVICMSDLVVAEKVNSPDWPEWALDDFARLYYHRDRIYCVNSLRHYIEIEQRTGEPTTSITHNTGATNNLRQLIHDCFRAPKEARKTLYEIYAHASGAFEVKTAVLKEQACNLQDLANDIQAKVPAKRLRQIAHNALLLPEMLIDNRFSETAVKALNEMEGNGPEFDAEVIVRANGVFMRCMYAAVAYGVKAHDQEGYADRPARRLLSDDNDQDIAVVASFTEKLVTTDKTAMFVDTAVRACLKRLPQLP